VSRTTLYETLCVTHSVSRTVCLVQHSMRLSVCHRLGVTNCVSRTTLYATLCVTHSVSRTVCLVQHSMRLSVCHRLGVTNCMSRTTLYETLCVTDSVSRTVCLVQHSMQLPVCRRCVSHARLYQKFNETVCDRQTVIRQHDSVSQTLSYTRVP